MSWELIDQTPYSSDWFDLYSAVTLNPTYYDTTNTSGYLRLSDYGCQVGEGWNCTAACLDTTAGPAMVWSNANLNAMYTLANCVMLPAIAALLAGGNLTASSIKVAEKFNIAPDATLYKTPAKAFPVINNCISAYCATDAGSSLPGCKPDNADVYQEYIFVPNESSYYNPNVNSETGYSWWPVNLTINGLTAFDSGVCHDLPALINTDIGGIGMFVSYMMQTFIVLSAWIAFHTYRSWAIWPIMLTLMPFHGPRRASTLAKDIQGKINSWTSALVAALVEFQKAQIFFMLSVQIAILVALHNPSYYQANSWEELWNNFGILFSLAFGGCLPVLFVMLMLRKAGKKEFYTLLITLCSVTLSGVTWFLAWYNQPDPNTSITAPDVPAPPECAGVPPIKYCYAGAIYSNADEIFSRAVPMLAFCFAVQLCFMIEHVSLFKISGPDGEELKGNLFQWLRHKILCMRMCAKFDDKAAERGRYARILHLDTSERIVGVVQGFIWLAAECTFVALNMILISDYAHLLGGGNDFQTINTKSWSLGQIISVTIWLPVLIEYVWQAIAGVEEGYKFRLPKGYRLVKTTEPETDDSAKIEAMDAPSSAVDMTPLKPIVRPGYERVDSSNW